MVTTVLNDYQAELDMQRVCTMIREEFVVVHFTR
jgi:hypothetical protein